MNWTKKVLSDAIKMVERLMKEYDVPFDTAVQWTHTSTMISIDDIKKAWHARNKEKK